MKYQPPAQTMESSLPVPEGGGVRVDTGVYEGGEIPMYYDSMIAKLIVHGLDRDDAIRRMREALNAFVIRGVSSNIPFQAALLAHPKFVAGDFNTGFIAEQYPTGSRRSSSRTTTRGSCCCWPARRIAACASARRASPGSCRVTNCRSPTTSSSC